MSRLKYNLQFILETSHFIFFQGLIVLPTAIINGTPLFCQYCDGNTCPELAKNLTRFLPDPEYNAWFVKNYCTYDADLLDRFVLYFPYFLLGLPLIILLIERGFVAVFKSGLKLDAFYNLLGKVSNKVIVTIFGYKQFEIKISCTNFKFLLKKSPLSSKLLMVLIFWNLKLFNYSQN